MKIQTGTGSIPLITLIAIWSISAVVSLPGLAISPILGDLDKIFPHTSDLELQMLTSLPSLLIIPFVLLSGKLSIGRDKIKILVLGLSLFFGSGILYFFAHSMTSLIIISCILGIGAGMMIPLSTGLIVDYFSGKYRVKQLGFSSSINNITLVLATLLTGYLANINWHYPFLVYTLPGGAIILSYFLRKKDNVDSTVHQSITAQQSTTVVVNTSKGIDKRMLLELMALYFFITYTVLVITFYLPFLAQDYHMSSGLSGMMISLFFLAIMIPGLFLNKVISTLKGNINFLSLLSIGVGLLCIFIYRERFAIIIGCMLTGFGYGVMQPLIYDKTATIAPAKYATYALSFVMAVNYLAIMVCPFIVDMFRTILDIKSSHFPFLMNAVLALILAWVAYFKRNSFALGLESKYYK